MHLRDHGKQHYTALVCLPDGTANMLLYLLVALLPLFSSLASATALTYKLSANEKACFFTDVTRAESKVAFYFAVS